MQHKDNYKRQAGLLLPIITQLCCATTLLFVSFNSHADIRGRVVRILDGDTLEVLQQNGELGVRLENGIYGHSRFCNTDFDDKLACLNLSGV
ncbi:hypothetical protein [Leclercia adecarboxylata]|uniref:hypothetical protein n=1 Tax=Leclercia adecarboxylata TaxID=83655 RepID=UPI00178C20DB|nr:hypothetical protein [Leclercia adecarboxylata]